MTALPNSNRPNTNNGPANIVLAAARLALGYVVAVAAGAIIFSILLLWTSGAGQLTASGAVEVAIICFVLGLLFAVPYTVIACLALKYLLPQSLFIVVIVGTLCPGVTILTTQLILGAVAWPAQETIKVLLLTIPTGLVSTYLFGAIGLGRWRLQ